MLKKLFLIYAFLGFASAVWAAPAEHRAFDASGEVLNVSPVDSRITIRHAAIPDFSGGGDTEFSVSDKQILEKISGGDLVNFTITDHRGDTRVTKIERTGVVEKEEAHLGQQIQQTLEGAGEAAKAITSPIAPVSEVVGAATDSTTAATGEVLNNASPQVKRDF